MMDPVKAVAEQGWEAILGNTYVTLSHSLTDCCEAVTGGIHGFWLDIISPVVVRISSIYLRISSWFDYYGRTNPETTTGFVAGYVAGTVIALLFNWSCLRPVYVDSDDDGSSTPKPPPTPTPIPASTSAGSTDGEPPTAPWTITVSPPSPPASSPLPPPATSTVPDLDPEGFGELTRITNSLRAGRSVIRSPSPPANSTTATTTTTSGVALPGEGGGGGDVEVDDSMGGAPADDPPTQPPPTQPDPIPPNPPPPAQPPPIPAAPPATQPTPPGRHRRAMSAHIASFVYPIDDRSRDGDAARLNASMAAGNRHIGLGRFAIARGDGRQQS